MKAPKDPDGSQPLKSAKQEKFAQACLTMSLSDAYRNAFDVSRMARPTVHAKASMLNAQDKVRARFLWLQKQTVSFCVMSVEERKAVLTTAIRNALAGLKPYLKALPEGDMVLDVNEGNLTQALESIEQHVRLGGEGGGADSVIRKAKVRDFLGYMSELNKLDGSYPAVKLDVEGPLTIIQDLPMPRSPRRRKKKKVGPVHQ
jgi:hypothetical protein